MDMHDLIQPFGLFIIDLIDPIELIQFLDLLGILEIDLSSPIELFLLLYLAVLNSDSFSNVFGIIDIFGLFKVINVFDLVDIFYLLDLFDSQVFFFYSVEGCFYTREKIEFSEITRLGVTRVINF